LVVEAGPTERICARHGDAPNASNAAASVRRLQQEAQADFSHLFAVTPVNRMSIFSNPGSDLTIPEWSVKRHVDSQPDCFAYPP
jgi:hypothetical protein